MGNSFYKSKSANSNRPNSCTPVGDVSNDYYELPNQLTAKKVIEDPLLWSMFESEVRNAKTSQIQRRLPIWKPSHHDFSLLTMSQDLAVWTEFIFAIQTQSSNGNTHLFRKRAQQLVTLIAELHTKLRNRDSPLVPLDHIASEAIINSCHELETWSLQPLLVQHIVSALVSNYRQSQVEYMIRMQREKQGGSNCQAHSITLTLYDTTDKKNKTVQFHLIKSLLDIDFAAICSAQKWITEIDFGQLSIACGKASDLFDMFIKYRKELRSVGILRFRQSIEDCELISYFNSKIAKLHVSYEMSNHDNAYFNFVSYTISSACAWETHDPKGGIKCGCHSYNWDDYLKYYDPSNVPDESPSSEDED